MTSRRDLPLADVVALATNEYERLLSPIDRTNGGTIRCLTLRCITPGSEDRLCPLTRKEAELALRIAEYDAERAADLLRVDIGRLMGFLAVS